MFFSLAFLLVFLYQGSCPRFFSQALSIILSSEFFFFGGGSIVCFSLVWVQYLFCWKCLLLVGMLLLTWSLLKMLNMSVPTLNIILFMFGCLFLILMALMICSHSFATSSYHPTLLVGLLGCIYCLYKADSSKSLLVGQHWRIHV